MLLNKLLVTTLAVLRVLVLLNEMSYSSVIGLIWLDIMY